MNAPEIGDRAEGVILAALVSAGKQVLLPFGGHCRYDLASEDNGQLTRIQCKAGSLTRGGAICFRTHSLTRGPARDYREDADYFAVYCHQTGDVYLIPVDDVPLRRAHLRVDKAKNGQRSGVRYARDYLLENVLSEWGRPGEASVCPEGA